MDESTSVCTCANMALLSEAEHSRELDTRMNRVDQLCRLEDTCWRKPSTAKAHLQSQQTEVKDENRSWIADLVVGAASLIESGLGGFE